MTYTVKDHYTHHVIFTGTLADCRSYVAAFGLCYVEGAPQLRPDGGKPDQKVKFLLFGQN